MFRSKTVERAFPCDFAPAMSDARESRSGNLAGNRARARLFHPRAPPYTLAMHVFDFLDLYVFPTGRRAFAQRQIAERAGRLVLSNIADHAQAAVAHESEILQLELERRSAGSSNARFSPETVKLDGLLDRAVTGFDASLDAQARIYGEDSERGQAAARIRVAVLPDGVGALTQLPYEQESEAVGAMFERLAKPDLAADIARIPGLADDIAQVRARHDAYRAALAKDVARPASASARCKPRDRSFWPRAWS